MGAWGNFSTQNNGHPGDYGRNGDLAAADGGGSEKKAIIIHDGYFYPEKTGDFVTKTVAENVDKRTVIISQAVRISNQML